jgi:hypothetical protein
MLYSYCTHTVLILYSCCTHAVLMLYHSAHYCNNSGTVLIPALTPALPLNASLQSPLHASLHENLHASIHSEDAAGFGITAGCDQVQYYTHYTLIHHTHHTAAIRRGGALALRATYPTPLSTVGLYLHLSSILCIVLRATYPMPLSTVSRT